MAAPTALVLRAPGTNCDGEAVFAFERAGAKVDLVHLNQLREKPSLLRKAQILVIPGGFSYGDDVAAGRIFASQLQHFLFEPDDDGPLATLARNESGKFEDRWVRLAVTPNKCPFLKDMTEMDVPVAHGEGNFVARKEWILKGLAQAGQVVLRYKGPNGHPAGYPYNPNGSQDDVAGICDATGRVLGLMPHPERHVLPTQHPQWTRLGLKPEGDGLKLFRNAVEFFKQ